MAFLFGWRGGLGGWRSCITFGVTTGWWAGQLAFLHHFLCHYRLMHRADDSLASLFVSLQAGGRGSWRSCITFCVTTGWGAGQLAFLHHFLCHYRLVHRVDDSLASLLVSLQAGGQGG